MSEIIRIKAKDAPKRRRGGHGDYEYDVRALVPRGAARQCVAGLYEIPPGKSNYPYHYHEMNEEVFYILSGKGSLRTPEGISEVCAGDFIFFPANEKGAHKLTNTSETEPLVYLDFDTKNEIDVCFYPDSGKIGVWGKEVNQLYKLDSQVDYYLDE